MKRIYFHKEHVLSYTSLADGGCALDVPNTLQGTIVKTLKEITKAKDAAYVFMVHVPSPIPHIEGVYYNNKVCYHNMDHMLIHDSLQKKRLLYLNILVLSGIM